MRTCTIFRRLNIKALTYTTVRSNLAKTMKTVCDDHDSVIITRKKHDDVIGGLWSVKWNLVSTEQSQEHETTSWSNRRTWKRQRKRTEIGWIKVTGFLRTCKESLYLLATYWQENPEKNKYQGIEKPEQLRHSLSGYWSRRITNEHRIVSKIYNDQVLIAQSRYHY